MSTDLNVPQLTQDQLDQITQEVLDNLPAPGDVTEEVSGVLTVLANTPTTFASSLTNITDTSIYNNVTGADLSEAFQVDVFLGSVTIEANQTVSNVVIKVTGN